MYQNYDGAEEHYLKAINLHWRSPDAHYNLGCLLQHHKGDLVEAEKQYRHAIKCDPKHGMAQYNLGWMLEKVGHGVGPLGFCVAVSVRSPPRCFLKYWRGKRWKSEGDMNVRETHLCAPFGSGRRAFWEPIARVLG